MRCVKKHGVSEIQHIPLTNLVIVVHASDPESRSAELYRVPAGRGH
jgi:hypothetical protein